ncbi:MAG: Acyl carrier protein, partial [uncultured Acetobacteraceae bacterium]
GLGVRPRRRHHRRDRRHPAREHHAGEPRHRRPRHRQLGLPRHCFRHRQGVRHQGAGGGLDAGSQRGAGAAGAVLRHGEPGGAHRGVGGGEDGRGL